MRNTAVVSPSADNTDYGSLRPNFQLSSIWAKYIFFFFVVVFFFYVNCYFHTCLSLLHWKVAQSSAGFNHSNTAPSGGLSAARHGFTTKTVQMCGHVPSLSARLSKHPFSLDLLVLFR